MKKQSGFTLIELLLVLAIIGIISAIAIPALLSQRARARDKAAIANVDGFISDGIGQYDKFREIGTLDSGAITTSLGNYLTANHNGDLNPWDGTKKAYNTTITKTTSYTSQAAMLAGVKTLATTKGEAVFAIQFPTTTVPGFFAGATLLQNTVNGSTKYAKASAIE